MQDQSVTMDRAAFRSTRHRGLSYRLRSDGSKAFYGYIGGRRMQLRASGERGAVAELGDLRGKVSRGVKVAPANTRFADVAEDWFTSRRKLRGWTKKGYRDALDLVHLPRFGHLRIGQVDSSAIARLVVDLEEQGLHAIDRKRPVRPLSQSSVANYLKPLSGTLSFAVRHGLIGTNPYRELLPEERPSGTQGRKKAYEWKTSEIDALLEAADIRARQRESQYDYSPLLRTAIFTGLRLGELLGLHWGDISFDEGVLHVRRQQTRMGELTPPKTASGLRRVPLTQELVKTLREHKLASRFSQDTDIVFASRAGGPLSHRNVQRRGFEPARDLAELPSSITFHDLRHGFASYAAHRGVPVKMLSEVMGHSDVGVTMKVYLHLFERDESEDAFRAAMSAQGPQS